MIATPDQRRLLSLCAIRIDSASIDWSLLAREATRPDGLDHLYAGHVTEYSDAATAARTLLAEGLPHIAEANDRVDSELAAAADAGARLVTVLDDDYPANLRLIPNLPPFLFILGDGPTFQDLRSVCVVGTRVASELGLRQASRMARLLTDAEVTVVSGLAKGIDTAAHRAALDHGGRTLAVIGTGITRTYPAENKALAAEIRRNCAVVSQFWPTASPAQWTFPRRNAVMSGIAQGTVVIEASSTSGAKMQARLALEHGKRVFLLKSLITDQEWARKYLDRGAIEVDDVDQVLEQLAEPHRVAAVAEQRRHVAQLTLDMV
jgi:DNA processing protein